MPSKVRPATANAGLTHRRMRTLGHKLSFVAIVTRPFEWLLHAKSRPLMGALEG